MPTILVVCTANQCRSPLGEAILQNILQQEHPDTAWQVESAGTWAINGRSAHPDMQTAAAEANYQLAEHRSRNVDAIPLEQFDLILTMEQSHKEALQIEFPTVRERIYLLSEMVGIQYDIPDPIGGPLNDYRATVRELERLFKVGLPRIVELSSVTR